MVTYPTSFGDGWVCYDAAGPSETGLPASSRPLPVTPPPRPSVVSDLIDGLTDYWQGAELPSATASILDRAATSPFLAEIYDVVAAIPRGTTMTYAAVAAAAGRPGAWRAVGAAMARNPFAPIIPCHRVIGSDRSLRGYAGGLDMKSALLALEGADV
jgi:O-6-methylguanine DNA methyltransferase